MIEHKSRRFITEAIEVEKILVYYEVRAKAKGKILIESEEYNRERKKLIQLICEMNKVANVEGKGRDDFSLNILTVAEAVIRKVSVNNSKSIRNIAEGVKTTFNKFRKMLEKYSENIETVDPQLKNNPELVENLFNLETAWDKAKEFLLSQENYSRLIFFSQLIEIICEKYKELTELIETRDPSIFVSVPGLLILKSLENEDQGICSEYNPAMTTPGKDCHKLYLEVKNEYDILKSRLDIHKHSSAGSSSDEGSRPSSRVGSSTKLENLSISTTSLPSVTTKKRVMDMVFLYNFLERLILFEENTEDIIREMQVTNEFYEKHLFSKFIGKIKTLSMNLQREKPTEWNSFFDMSMTTITS